MHPKPEPRAAALACFLRREAGAVSLSAEMTGHPYLVHVGMAMLDAAALAQDLDAGDPILLRLSQAGCFESMPDDRAKFVSTDEIQRAILRPVSGDAEAGATILQSIVTAADKP
jgi:hypothetical protein